jgi:hypothetical protein
MKKKEKRVKGGMETGEKGEMLLISTLSPVSIPPSLLVTYNLIPKLIAPTFGPLPSWNILFKS